MQGKENPIKSKSYIFSIKIVELYRDLVKEHKDYVLSKQILKSGTSIGANVHEAIGGQSKPDFISKMQIAYKEALETEYWLNLLKDTGFINEELYNDLINHCEEIVKILTSILNTSKKAYSKR